MERGKIRIGIVGVGNCACSLIQGISYYKDVRDDEHVPGLMHVALGGYRPQDIEVACAFDIAHGKVGRDVAEAIFAPPNNTLGFGNVNSTGTIVDRGPTMDGLGKYLRGTVEESEVPPADVAAILRSRRTDVLISYLPVGSERATAWYADQALAAKCAFINCIPSFVASRAEWRQRFEQAGLPLIGDDIKSQVGATIVHRMLVNLFRERGVRVDRTYQLNFGGNADFLNMLERERLESKRISKTQSVTSQLDAPLSAENIHVGPSDHVAWLADRKWAYIRLEGTTFGGTPLNAELKLEVWDSPNSAGVVIDAVRCAKLALDRRIAGALLGPSGYFMKSPPQQYTEAEARRLTLDFIAGQQSLSLEAAE
jgi:myo-inositol-1-phosphate synthase